MMEVNSFARSTWRNGLGALYLPDAGTGSTTWADYSGNGNTATLVNSANFANATGFNSRRVLVLNAAGTATIPNTASLQSGVKTLSVAAWIHVRNPPGATHLGNIFANEGGSGASVVLRLGWGDSGRRMRPTLVFYNGSWPYTSASVDVPQNQWTFIAITTDGTSMRFYINDALVTTNGFTSTANNGSNVFTVGNDSVGGRNFDGSVGMLAFWPKRTVSGEELKALYEATK